MKNLSKFSVLMLSAGLLLAAGCQKPLKPAQITETEEAPGMDAPLLIDDFASAGGTSALGTRWQRFTDQVMGGVSTANHEFMTTDDGHDVLHLTGDVSLENNGGFVQVALPLAEGNRPVDMSEYRGIRLVVRGNGEGGYYVHLRTSATWMPWQFYKAPFDAPDRWETVEIPWVAFSPDSLDRPFDPGKLKRVAVVAAFREMSADIMVDRIELYR